MLIKKKIIIFINFILIILLILYFIPIEKKGFLDLYQKKDNIREEYILLQNQPLKNLMKDNADWKYYFQKSKNPNSPTILFLHGMTGGYDIWWQQIIFFQKEFHIISYTLPKQVDSLKEAINGILEILQRENISKVILVGSSMGGYIAQYFLKTNPKKVQKVVFGNTFPPNTYFKNQNDFKAKMIVILPSILFDYLAIQNFKKVIFPTSLNSEPLKGYLLSFSNPKIQFLNRYKIITDFFEIEPRSKEEIQIPKLILISKNDPLVPEFLREELLKVYPESEVYSFEEEGHFPYVVDAKKYNQIVLNFLKK